MSTYTDNNTGKQYSINGLTITQTRDGVKLGETTMPTAAALLHWLEMMGFKVPKLHSFVVTAIKSRNKRDRDLTSFVRAVSAAEAIEIVKSSNKHAGLMNIRVMTGEQWDAIKAHK